jgi:hypothetical protein
MVASDPWPIDVVVVDRGRAREPTSSRHPRVDVAGEIRGDGEIGAEEETLGRARSRATTWFGGRGDDPRVANKARETSPDAVWSAFVVGSNESASSEGSARRRRGGKTARRGGGDDDDDARVVVEDAGDGARFARARDGGEGVVADEFE